MSRFQPTRAGIINIWDYTNQEFHFADGRLVLRGPNGSGKTKALEVLVPFVLDGSINPRRLDPFSGKDRTMKSNLLYGGDKVRRGYCWMEFRMGAEVVTVGVGMRAQAHNNDVKTWYFVTDRVVGESLHLVNDARVPMTQKAMRTLLDETSFFTTAKAHRHAVNRHLFGFEGERYRAMIELILTLRRPQLAKQLNPESLSGVLSDGLRTVDPKILEDSAEAFTNLEATERDRNLLEQADGAVTELMTAWRTYLRTQAQHRLVDLVEKKARVMAAERARLELSKAIAEFENDADEYKGRATQARARVETAQATIAALMQRDAYKGQGQLADAGNLVQTKKGMRDTAERALGKRERALAHERRGLDDAMERLGRAEAAVDKACTDLMARCGLVGMPRVAPIDADELGMALRAQQRSVHAVLKALEALEKAERALIRAEEALQQRILELENAASAEKAALEVLSGHIVTRADAIDTWHQGLSPQPQGLLEPSMLRAAAPALDGEPDLRQRVNDAWRPFKETMVEARGQLKNDADGHRLRVAEFERSLTEIRAEKDDAPRPPATRQSLREGREGAPFWRLVHFADGVDDAERATLEGALLAAGVLDAWVAPGDGADGGIEEEFRDDTYLRVGPAVAGASLATLLVPEVQEAVAYQHIDAILKSISLDDAHIHIGRDGRFALGPLAGAHRPASARYIGATARRQHREARIAELLEQRAMAEAARLETQGQIRDIDRVLEELKVARRTLPKANAVQKARRLVEASAAVAERALAACTDSEARRDEKKRLAGDFERDFRRTRGEHHLSMERDALRPQAEQLRGALEGLKDYTAADAQRMACDEAQRAAQERHDGSAQEVREVQQAAETARNEYEGERQRFETLNATLGAEVAEIQVLIETAEAAKREAGAVQNAANHAREAANERASEARGKLDTMETLLPNQYEDRRAAALRLAPFQQPALAELLGVLDGDGDFDERLATRVGGASSSEERLKSTATRLNNLLDTLDDALGARFRHRQRTDDGIVIISVLDGDDESDIVAFHRRNSERLERVRDLLMEQERKVFEEQLLKHLITRLRARIEEARLLATAMDAALRERKLASGKYIGIQWKPHPDSDPTRRDLITLLARDPAFLSVEKLEQMRAHLSADVRAERRDHPDHTYSYILARALDYRSWHRFELYLYDASGGKKRLTASTHAQLSGGEKAATVHLPLFAAAHAHFSAARDTCPRLIALDEAFAGIDETGTPELLRLAHEFDLDWFLTGHNLWVTEPFLPAVQHYDLAHEEATRAVSAWPILWNGRETVDGVDGVHEMEGGP